MKTLCCIVLVAVAGSIPFAVQAEPPRAESSQAELLIPRSTGHVLILRNERILEGDIVREDDRYRIRRSVGESWVPCEMALHLSASLEDAYQYLRGRTNLRDADERMRLARWCQLHGLRKQGLEEAQAAVELKPHSDEAQRLLRLLTRSAAPEAPPTASKAALVLASSAPQPLAIDLGIEAMGTFSRSVQPILMNTCASCHATGKGGAFKLVHTFGDGTGNFRLMQQNLAAVLAQLNTDHWQTSPLLIKAVSVHGENSQPPLKNRQSPAFRNLEEWVQLAAAHAPAREATVATKTTESIFAKIDATGRVEQAEHKESWAVDNKSARTGTTGGEKPKENVQAAPPGEAGSKAPEVPALTVVSAANRERVDPTAPGTPLPPGATPHIKKYVDPAPAVPGNSSEPTTKTHPDDPYDAWIFNRQGQ